MKRSRGKVSDTIAEFIETLIVSRSQGTREEKIARAIAVMYKNEVLTLDQVSGLLQEYGVTTAEFDVQQSEVSK